MADIPRGCSMWRTGQGIAVARIHYSADPAKDAQWVSEAKKRYLTQAAWSQEMEIQGDAQAGQLVFPNFRQEFTVCEPFPIPHEWTRYFALDPHPRTPHAMLWLAVSPFGQHFCYREFWPSRIYGLHGDLPEDEELHTIPEYVAVIKWLQDDLDWHMPGETKTLRDQGYGPIDTFGPRGFADNGGKKEHIYRKIMDPYGRAVALDRIDGKEGEVTFWDRYKDLGLDCEPAVKDWNSSTNLVNDLLRPRKYSMASGIEEQSVIRIFSTLPELILELQTNRYPKLTPTMATKGDPADTPLPKRKHLSDLLRYIEMGRPIYVDRTPPPAEPPRQIYEGIAW